mgnify:CR=1 FL=1
MTLEQALLKIIELQQQVADLKEQVQEMKSQIIPQPIMNPFISISSDYCTDGGSHNYPIPWMSVTPPHCTKCGKQAQNNIITSYTLTNSSNIRGML